ncbi:MAG TPA: universal stress protein [Planctomycetota bacterium]|nr:universal stress protein [Planctomycetota bacterium]
MAYKILVPLDGSPEAESILPEALRLAPPDGEVHLLHVVPLPTPPTGEPTRMLGLPEKAEPYLESVRRNHSAMPGLDLVRSGPPADAILQVALEMNIDLVAMTTHARRGLGRWYLGSVAESVVRRTELPVLLKRPGQTAAISPLRRILVPLDGSERSASILDTVKPLAARSKAELVLLHVAPRVLDPAPQWAMKGPISPGGLPENRYQALADELELENLNAWPVMAEGEAAHEILSRARELNVDLVAMATHGRTGFMRTLFGSVTSEVLQKIDRPILLIRPTKGASHE